MPACAPPRGSSSGRECRQDRSSPAAVCACHPARVAVRLHVAEPDVVRTAGVGLGEEQHGGGDPGVGLEDARGHGDDGIELLLLDQDRAQGSVRLARSEEHAVGHDDRGASSCLEKAEEEGEEQQLGLLRLDDLLQILSGVLVVEAASEGRIGQHQRVLLLLAGVVLRQRVPVADARVLYAVQQHVHAADAQHGVVEVEAMEQAVVEVLAQLRVVQQRWVALAQVLAGRGKWAISPS